MEDILIYIYYAVHMTAAAAEVFLRLPVLEVQTLGPAAWGLSALWLVLLGLDWTGRVNLHGPAAKTLSALMLPLAGGDVGLLFRPLPGTETPPAVWSCFLLLLVLLWSILLRPLKGERAPADRAVELLDRGSGLGILIGLWLSLLAGAVLLMATVGFLFTLIIGALIASRNTLLEYEGLVGILLSLLALHLLQTALYWRGFQLSGRKSPGLGLLLPVWNTRQARRLCGQLRTGPEVK